MEITTWADFGALTKEELEAYLPEELETLKTSIKENEVKLEEGRKIKDEEGAKAKELADNYKIRAEKAEGKLKEPKETKEVLSGKDALILVKEGISEPEDLDEIESFVAWKKTVNPAYVMADALKDKVLRTVLATKAEERKTALLTQTRGTGTIKTESSDEILAQAQKGQFSEKDEDIDKLVEARFIKKSQKTQR